jgi:hypothetical protein
METIFHAIPKGRPNPRIPADPPRNENRKFYHRYLGGEKKIYIDD